MNRTDSSSPLAEDRVHFPDAWREHTYDWRSRGGARPVEVDPTAPERLQRYFDEYREAIEPAVELIQDPAHAAAIRDGMAGKADPLGAAAALELLVRVVPRTYHREPVVSSAHRNGHQELYRTGLDAWLTAHGAPFAAEAVLELLGRNVYWYRGSHRAAASITDAHLRNVFHRNDVWEKVGPLRSLLAAMPEDEYAKVRDAVAGRRTSEAKQFFSAVLMPEQEAWAAEACDLHAGYGWAARGSLIWAVAATAELRDRSGAQTVDLHTADPGNLSRLLDALGVEALPILVNTLESEDRPSAEVRQLVFEALSALPADGALAYLLSRLTNPAAMAAALVAAQRFPARTLRAVAAMAPATGAAERARLAGFVRANALLDKAEALADADRERVEALLASTRRHPEAAELPAVFTTPPWAPFAKGAGQKPITGLVPPGVDELRWAPGEREAWTEIGEAEVYWRRPETWDRFQKDRIESDPYLCTHLLAYGPQERAEPAFARWDGSGKEVTTESLQAILARFGQDAAAKVQGIVVKRPSHRIVLGPFVNLETARVQAARLRRSRADRTAARAWFDRHPADAAALLVPDAVGKDAKLRRAACEALRHLAADRRALVDERAAAYGPEAAAAVAAILDADPLDPQLARLPKPGAWADTAMLPQVLLAGGEAALPDAAVRTLLTALALEDADRPYPGIDLLAAECDPASLAAFSWGLFELWLSAGAPAKDAWAMDQLRRFADDDTVRRLTALVAEWPGQNQNRRAAKGLEVLGAIGSEAALRAVHGLSQKAKFKALKKTAAEQIEVIADRLELSLDQLADRLVPDFGLDAEAATVLDYGPRSFTIRFDENLKPYLVDDAGKRRASAPKPGAQDDPELAPAAYERFGVLRKELKSTSAEQVRRLESAMVQGRSWSAADFRAHLVEHPLVWHLSSRLVWEAETAEGRRSFRLAEDRTLADVEDEPFDLPADATVRIAHPLALGSSTVEEWATVLADYEILQPFEQLGRAVFELDEEDRRTGSLARFAGAVTGASPLLGLLKRGWKYGSPAGRGGYGNVFREFPGGGHLLIVASPGVYPGYGHDDGDQTLTVEIALPEDAAVDPLAVSEAIRAVARLTRTA